MKRYKEQDAAKVANYLEQLINIDPGRLVYVDETGVDTFLHREYACARRGEKVISRIPGKKYRRVGIVAAQRGKEIISPLQFDGTMDSLLFEYWFENCLMCELPPRSVIVMDNAAFHRKKRLALIVDGSGHSIVFLPPYSPELNPIENFWAWLKGKLKKFISSFESFDKCLCYCFNCI